MQILTCPGPCSDDFLGITPISPTIVENPILMIVGEAAGKEEVKEKRFFAGKSGKELTQYLIKAGIPRHRCHITNILKCQPPGNRDPKRQEIETCSVILWSELEEVRPRFVAAVGRVATRFFLGDMDISTVHGIPFKVNSPSPSGFPLVVIPVYHPAAALRDTAIMSLVMGDMLAVKAVMRGNLHPREREISLPVIKWIVVGDEDLHLPSPIFIDTETADDEDTPWCAQFGDAKGSMGYIVMASNTKAIRQIANHVSKPDVLTVMHNSLFDLKVLRQMGIRPLKYVDTMIMAYLLQIEPQGLKQLTFRHFGVEMSTFEEMVGDQTQEMAMSYLREVAKVEWPLANPILEYSRGIPKIRQPQSINQRVKRIFTDMASGKEVDVYNRWNKIELEEGRGLAEACVGKMNRAYLKDIEPEKAFGYAATDIWASTAIFPILQEKVCALGLEDTLDRDSGMVPMVEVMQAEGMLTDPPYFVQLRSDFAEEMEKVQVEITKKVGYLNPGSDVQVFNLLVGLKLIPADYRRKGATDLEHMELLHDKHPVLPLIMRWRALHKLVNSFIDVLLEKKNADNRIRTTLRITRVVTGRLSSSSPNLMAQPVRTEDGRKIRGGFIARKGCSLCSFDYCLAPETRVLTYDLRWVPVASLKEGDLLWGVDEERPCKGGYRKMRASVVENLKTRIAPSCMLVTEDGKTIVCSEEHKWYARRTDGSRRGEGHTGSYCWVKTKDLTPQWEIWNAVDVWEQDISWESGYLAGIFDGEGSISVGRGIILTFTQKAGLVLSIVEQLLNKQGYEFHAPYGKIGGFTNSKEVMSIWISNRRDIARFLGVNRPTRLLTKAFNLFEGRRPPQARSVINQVIPLGDVEVISVQTSTKTLIAEGLISHNSQIEMRVVAHDSQDRKMMSIFRNKEDIHSATASNIFHLPIDQLDEMKHRYPSKRVGFGILNLISPKALLRELTLGGAEGWTVAGCTKIINDWFTLYEGVAAWIEEKKTEAYRTGMVRDMFGRIRLVPEVISSQKYIREAGLRQAVNAPIQMGAQGIIKEAMRQLVPFFREWMGAGRIVIPLLQIHDDLIWEIEDELMPIVVPLIKDIMEHCISLSVPLQVDVRAGKRWNTLNKM